MRGLPVLREAVAGLYGVEAGEVIIFGRHRGAGQHDPGAGAAGRRGICIQPLYDAYLPLVARAGGWPGW
jgi:hypothetical protein